MTGKLKTRGNMMLATKLEQVLKVRNVAAMKPFLSLTLEAAYPPGR